MVRRRGSLCNGWIVAALATCMPPLLSAQQDTVVLDGAPLTVIDRQGAARLLLADGPEVRHMDRRGRLRYRWYMVQDSTLGVVFRRPSGVKQHNREPLYDGDIDLTVVDSVYAVEVRVLTFNVWRELTGVFVVTRVQDYVPGDRVGLDPRWEEGWDSVRLHFISIVFVSRVLGANEMRREADWEAITAFARLLQPTVTLEDVRAGLQVAVPDSTGSS